VLGLHELEPEAQRFVDQYCERELDPLLTPVTVDPAHTVSAVYQQGLCLGFLLRRPASLRVDLHGRGGCTSALPRLVRLPSEGTADFIFLADLVAQHAVRMYRGYDIVSSAPFRVTRNSNLYLQEEEARSLLESVRAELHNRRKGDAVRMEIELTPIRRSSTACARCSSSIPGRCFRSTAPVNLSRLFNIYEAGAASRSQVPHLCPAGVAPYLQSKDLFEELRRHDILLHHPYDSYDAVVSFIESAAEDDRVLSISRRCTAPASTH